MQTAAHSDESLVALVARGDEAALGTLYDRYGRSAYGLALRVLCDRHLAEDAVQNAFLDVWRTAGRFTDGSSVRAWLMMLTHRRAVDLVRRTERWRRVTVEPIPSEVGPTGEEDAMRRLDAERVRAALASIPTQERHLLELAYYGGLTQTQLAERLALPVGTVKSRMFSGLARLRDLLAAESPLERAAAVPSSAAASAR